MKTAAQGAPRTMGTVIVDHAGGPTTGSEPLNELQQLIADAMTVKGYPVGERGSKAWLARTTGVSRQVITYLFQRPEYVPEPETRDAIRRALGIPLERMERAAVRVKGARIYTFGEDEMIAALSDLSDDELREIRDRAAAALRARGRHRKS